ncbi:conserved hypothetical protein [Ricinus communis]|uniref:Uncharacterized protein n=1 Tax=Ricinus communis TaxID=3988 RepID=B9RAL5_RICCO|nr:conserved hypothetical protein [Ricinus communis]
MGRNVELISKEFIRPSSPTPHHLRNYNLSFLDQIAPAASHSFYEAIMIINDSFGTSIVLKNSLPKTINPLLSPSWWSFRRFRHPWRR